MRDTSFALPYFLEGDESDRRAKEASAGGGVARGVDWGDVADEKEEEWDEEEEEEAEEEDDDDDDDDDVEECEEEEDEDEDEEAEDRVREVRIGINTGAVGTGRLETRKYIVVDSFGRREYSDSDKGCS